MFGVVLMYSSLCCSFLVSEFQDLKKKEKELQAKEAELKRREQVPNTHTPPFETYIYSQSLKKNTDISLKVFCITSILY